MLDSIPVSVLTGLILGYLAAIGIGGGSLLMLWLTLVVGTGHMEARLINLMFFVTAAGSVSVFRWKQSNFSIKRILPAMIAGCIASAITTALSTGIDTDIIKRVFGILLLIAGVKEICYRPRKER